jgi:uncharacterized protein YozE (UPF0346 family)
MSIDISRVARAVCDFSAGSKTPIMLSHAQQCVAAAFGFKSLAAYQAAKKLEAAVDDYGLFLLIDEDLLAQRARELVESSDGGELSAFVGQAIRDLYPDVGVYGSRNLRRVSVTSAIAALVGLDPILVGDLDDATFQVIENERGELQGFLFNFDEPDWAELASDIRGRHGSLSVYAPASFLRMVKGCEAPERWYVHGDQSEDQPLQYFCRACGGAFKDAAHFDSDEHKDHGSRYFDGLRTWDRGVARWKLPKRRAINAPNIVAAKAEEERLAAEAARGDFHQWIEQQVGRDDVVGDVAKDVMRDKRFPKGATTRDEVVDFVKAVTTRKKPIAAMKAAWGEFARESGQAGPVAEAARKPTWPVGPEAINAIAMPPDERARLVPQLTLLEAPGRVYWRFLDGDDFESSSDEPLATLEQALEDLGADSTSHEWVDITYRGVVWGSCQQWELAPYAAKIASDLRAKAAQLNR